MNSHEQSRGTSRVLSWWLANLAALLPAAIVALLFINATHELGRLLFGCALAWAAAAILSARLLEFWHWITRRFDVLSWSTTLTIALIVGALVGFVAASIAADPLRSAFAFAASLLGSLQGAAAVWFIVGPDIAPPPEWQDDPETEDGRGDDTPNPPTSTP